MNAVDTKSARTIPGTRITVALTALALFYLYVLSGNAQETAARGHSALLWMIGRWNGAGGDLSHGWLIPLVSAYVIWQRRAALRAAPRRPLPIALILVASCLLLHGFGYRTQLTRLSLFSLVGLSWAIPLACRGYAFARHLIFPCSYLIFCVPLSFLDSLTVPLRTLTSAVTTVLLNGLGIAAVRQGTIIEALAHNGFKIDVADPCSGLRSLLAMTALTAVYAAFTQKTLLRKWLLFLCAVPVAMLGNIARILSIAVIAQAFGQDAAIDFYHDYSGYVVFIVAVLAMAACGRLIDRARWPFESTRRTQPRKVGETCAKEVGKVSAPVCYGLAGLTLATVVAFLLMPPVINVAELGVADALPVRVGDYSGTDIAFCQNEQCLATFDVPTLTNSTHCPICGGALDSASLAERRTLPRDTEFLKKRYDAAGLPSIFVSVVFSGSDQRSIHRPQQCLPAQGGTIEAAEVVTIPQPGNAPLRASLLSVRSRYRDPTGVERQRGTDFAYWFVSAYGATPYTLSRLALTMRDRILYGRNYRWAYVAVFTDMPTRGDPQTRQRLLAFIAALNPQLAP